MFKKFSKRLLPILLAMMLLLSTMPLGMIASAAKTNTVLDGAVSITDSTGNGSNSNGTVTIKASGSLFSKATNTITIANETENRATLSFAYSTSQANSFTIAGVSAPTTGNYSIILDAGASFEIKLQSKSGLSGTTATLTLSSFSLVAAADSSDVTFEYNSAYGSITVNGAATASGTVINIPIDGAALVATTANGGTFLGWINAADGAILSTAASYTVTPAADMTVKAVFIGSGSEPHFMIGALVNESYKHGLLNLTTTYYPTVPKGTHLFDDLNAAAQASAASNSSKAIVLLNDSTLPAGDYTIPSGSTLVIPMDSKNTYYTTEPRGREYNNDLDGDGSEQQNDPTKTERYQHTITAYRTLTMANGANIIINGGMSVPAMHLWAQGGTYVGGSPCDAVGMVVMEEGSSITVNNGGVLYAYGYITGSGSVSANSGAKVYEYFQIPDFRGGTQSTDMQNGVFPLSQYYVQNIEVPLKINSGAQEYSYTSLYMSRQDVSSSVAFIGPSNSMFNLTSGYVIKRYDVSTDRLIIELNGNMTVSPVSLKLGTNTLDSNEYELPINSNITVTAKSGSNIVMNQDLAMLPGSEIIIEDGANCTVGNGINIYIYDLDQWGNYAGATNQQLIPVVNIAPVPGRVKYTRTAADLTDAKIQIDGYIDASAGYVYTTSSGANVFSTGTGVAKVTAGTETVTYVLNQGTGYVQIPIKPAFFKNSNGTYLYSATDTYTYTDGKWVCTNHTTVTDAAVDPTCTNTGLTVGEHCSACGEVFIEQEQLPKIDHSYTSEDTKKPDCETEGVTTFTCTVCGHITTEPIAPTGHECTSVITTEPGCETEGVRTYTCTNEGCSYSYTEKIEANGHDYSIINVTEPTCTEKGYTTFTCSVCGDSYNDNFVSASGHSYGDWTTVTAPDCETVGSKQKVCATCGDVQTEAVAALGHAYSTEYTVDVEATDITEGSESRHCANCDSTTDVRVIPAKTAFTGNVGDTITINGYNEAIEGAITIPETLNGKAVASIADNAFANQNNLTMVTIPVCVTSISNTAFSGCDSLQFVLYNGTIAQWKNVAVDTAATFPNAKIVYLGETVGDVDASGEVDANDATTLRNIILGNTAITELSAYTADTNGDGKVNVKDLVRLKKYFANISVYMGIDYSSALVSTSSAKLYNSSANNVATLYSVATVANGEPEINDYESFLFNLMLLEELASIYSAEVKPGTDPLDIVIKYVRTGVDRYNSGSWNIMAGYEDPQFAEFVLMMQESVNQEATCEEEKIHIDALKNINNFYLPNGDWADLGHMFGTMDITNHNKGSQNHADVGGWAGDLVDLLEVCDINGVSGELETMVANISKNYLGVDFSPNPGFNDTDIYGDIDAFYVMQQLYSSKYEHGVLTEILLTYFTEDLDNEFRAEYFLKNRLGSTGTRAQIRDIVYNAYTTNKVISTLEGTREFSSSDLSTLRRACCYAFADYLCELAGDYVDSVTNPYLSVFSNDITNLAPGVTQEIKYATSADNKQMVYYIATADITRNDVDVFANYNENDPSKGWELSRVLDQANAAQNKYGNPESEYYIENYNVVASTNGAGFNMATGEPGGLLVMGGVEYQPINSNGFFGILMDGTPVIATTEEYNTIYKGQVRDGIACFGDTLVKNGKIVTTNNSGRASRTAVGITKTGKVVLMVLDGRQEPVSCGGSMLEIAQIMLDAGCVHAVNLDGGGSTTYVSKPVGSEDLAVINKPSDGYARSVSTSLMIVSTAPSSTKFDHAVLNTDYDYLTIGTSIKVNPVGVSATGNVTELPEGTTWAVSDTRWATITEDGVLTAHRNGTVEVYLVLDDAIIGSKTIDIVTPQNLYYSRTIIDAVYGESINLPIIALYQNQPVAINVNDIAFTLSSPTAGDINNFTFVGNEASGIKVLTITAALTSNTETTADLTINLYKQGEATFDFDQATGGDRQLAWDRQVSNSTTTDGITYIATSTDEEMVTSYIVAIDMTEIPIPPVLNDLLYMLPGADVEGACAWTFLCQLAERISDLSVVTAKLKFDSNFDVDYSELKLINEYFNLETAEFDEATNTLTINLRWRKQTKAIDQATANPICIVNGIKLTPKSDADWGAKNSLKVENTGNISYKIYLRASALYSFAQKPENQAQYGIYPFVNPNNSSESGGYFSHTYKEFYDTYNLVNALKNGWANEDGGFVYYVDGEKLTGVQLIDGYYYDFGTNGINAGQTKYTGVFFDKELNAYRYSKIGEIATNWQTINGEWYHFNTTTTKATTGRVRMYGVYYTFEETGKLTTGVWGKTLNGTRYYYGPSYYIKGWYNIDGIDYFFRNGYRCEGINYHSAPAMPTTWYDFGPDGTTPVKLNGIFDINGELRYFEEGIATEKHLIKVGEDYYYTVYNGVIVTNKTLYTASTNCDLPKGSYTFGADGKMLGSNPNGEIVEINGIKYYYENGKGAEKYLVKVDGEYYFAQSGGKVITNKTLYAWATNCDMPKGTYIFGEDGKMVGSSSEGEIVEIDGVRYYYENGKGVEKGLVKVDGNYYFALYQGKLITNRVYHTYKTSCDLPNGHYEFDAEGKMINGIIERDGILYYYENGKGVEKGLFEFDGNYYFALYQGKLITNRAYSTYKTSCDLPNGRYEFGADGKMLKGIVDKDGVLYYYENGKGIEKGLFEFEGNYYFALYQGKLLTNRVYKTYKTSCDLPNGTYEFGADGKMLNGIVDKDGVLYYYENGVGVEKGLFEYEGNYYFALYRGKLITSRTYKAYKTSCDLPIGTYEFGADGKMLNGIVEKEDGLYYYENGVGIEKGLFEYEGNYYFALYRGKLVTSRVYKAYKTSCDLPTGTYEFGADGKMLNGIVEKEDGLYYYENGKGIEKGLFFYDGYYYFSAYNGELVTNRDYHVWRGNGLLVEQTYTFNELGQIVG
ncbi:MAG: hypothetical protein E7562_03210 [Ruminococcaceae bacterium]|nr:hypothetical protein [Oscillospiraceae bacterium]